jgi:hypothetical protein
VGFCLLLACLMSLEAFRRLAPAKQSRVVIGTPFAVARILLAHEACHGNKTPGEWPSAHARRHANIIGYVQW